MICEPAEALKRLLLALLHASTELETGISFMKAQPSQGEDTVKWMIDFEA